MRPTEPVQIKKQKLLRGGRFELPTNGSLRDALYSPLLYQLSYPRCVTEEGFEPPAFGSGIQRAAVAPWALVLANGVFHSEEPS